MNQPAPAVPENLTHTAVGSTAGRGLGDAVSPWAVLAVAVLAVTVTFYNLGGYRTLASHEAFAMVPAREMLASGDWVVPRYGGLPRLEKPPLVYWLIAGTAGLFGQLNELTGRLHSAMAGLGLALLMGLTAARWWGPRVGLAAGLIQSTVVYVLIFARKAEVDMLLCLLTTGALLLVAGHRPDESRRHSFIRFAGMWALVALSWMAKFHYGPAMVLCPCIAWFVVQQWWGSLLRLLNPVGLALMAAAVLIWPQMLLEQVPEAFSVWNRQTIGRAVGDMGYRPVWFYLPHLLWLPLPWTPLVIAAVPASWRSAWSGWPGPAVLYRLLVQGRTVGVPADFQRSQGGRSNRPGEVTQNVTLRDRLTMLWNWWSAVAKRGDIRERFLWVWLLVPLLIVTVQAQKHKHYLMAALPVLTFLGARVLAEIWNRLCSGQPLLTLPQARLLWSTTAAGCLALATYVGVRWPSIALPAAMTCGSLVAGAGLSFWLLLRQKNVASLAAIAATFLCCYSVTMSWMMPVRDYRRPIARFAREVRDSVQNDQPVAVFAMGMHPVVYYLENPVRRVESKGALRRDVQKYGRLQVVLERRQVGKLNRLMESAIVAELQPDPELPPEEQPELVLAEFRWIGYRRPQADAPLQQADRGSPLSRRKQ